MNKRNVTKTKKTDYSVLEIKREAQALYFRLRELGVDHTTALGTVVQMVCNEFVQKDDYERKAR